MQQPTPLGFSYGPCEQAFIAWYLQESWRQGQLRQHGPIAIDPACAALNYGATIFDGLKARRLADGSIGLFRPDANAARFHAGAERLTMPPVPQELFMRAVQAVVRANQEQVPHPEIGDLYLRPQLFGHQGVLGLQAGSNFTFYLWANPVGLYFPQGLAPGKFLIETTAHRAVRGGTGAVKAAGNYAAALCFSKAAKAAGYAEVIWLDAEHASFPEEVGAANLFCVKDGVLYTPPLTGTILPGVTRDSIITIAREILGIEVREDRFSVEFLLQADEAFCTGTAAVISPMGFINHRGTDHPIGDGVTTGAMTRLLHKTLTDIQYGRAEDPFRWVVRVE